MPAILPIPVVPVCDPPHHWRTGLGHGNMQVALANASPALPGSEAYSGWLSSRHLISRGHVGSTCIERRAWNWLAWNAAILLREMRGVALTASRCTATKQYRRHSHRLKQQRFILAIVTCVLKVDFHSNDTLGELLPTVMQIFWSNLFDISWSYVRWGCEFYRSGGCCIS